MSTHEGIEVPNDPHQRPPPRGRFICLRGPMPFVAVSLGLWVLLLNAIPAWMIGDLVVALLASCVTGALVPLQPRCGSERSDLQIGPLVRDS